MNKYDVNISRPDAVSTTADQPYYLTVSDGLWSTEVGSYATKALVIAAAKALVVQDPNNYYNVHYNRGQVESALEEDLPM
jgi:hypothetical protein